MPVEAGRMAGSKATRGAGLHLAKKPENPVTKLSELENDPTAIGDVTLGSSLLLTEPRGTER
jgi:hypothetical protein